VVRRHDPQGRFEAEPLFMEDPVCVAARDNPAFPDAGALDLDSYLTLRHVRITILDKDRGWIDDLLRERGLERRVALTVPHYSVAAAVAAASDLVATLPLSVVGTYSRLYALKTAPLPFAPKPYGAILVWPKTRTDDPAHAWLRRAVGACFADASA
jgi:DNA-binding transcriptional LysR family regulator